MRWAVAVTASLAPGVRVCRDVRIPRVARWVWMSTIRTERGHDQTERPASQDAGRSAEDRGGVALRKSGWKRRWEQAPEPPGE